MCSNLIETKPINYKCLQMRATPVEVHLPACRRPAKQSTSKGAFEQNPSRNSGYILSMNNIDRLWVGWGGTQDKKVLKGHLPIVVYYQVYNVYYDYATHMIGHCPDLSEQSLAPQHQF